MLHGQTFLVRATPSYLLIPCHEQIDFIVIGDLRNDESGRCRVKDSIASFFGSLIGRVVVLKRANEPCLSCDTSRVLKVVQKDGIRWIRLESGIHLIIALIIEIQLSPVEVTSVDG